MLIHIHFDSILFNFFFFDFAQKYKDPNAMAEMNSLKYAQKMIDLRLSHMQNNKSETDRDCNSMANLPIIPLDELLNKEITLSYYLDYLSVSNHQRYVIFYLSAKGMEMNLTHVFKSIA